MGELLALLAIPALIISLIGFILLLVLAFFAFWLWMLIDAIIRKDWTGSEQVAWIIVIVLVNWLGALIYLFAVKLPRGKKRRKK